MAIDGPTHGLRIVAPKNGVGGKNTSSNTPGRAALNELINEIGYSNVVKNTVQDWMDSLNAIRKKTGFAFNCLSNYSDEDKRRNDLFYADPCELFDHCKNSYSQNVTLLHDYGLYEFTILVRK